ncbi:unnamed protein product, partial [marine sediment metagenome]
NTGFIRVKAIKNRKQLSNYFMKDEEWYIPWGVDIILAVGILIWIWILTIFLMSVCTSD